MSLGVIFLFLQASCVYGISRSVSALVEDASAQTFSHATLAAGSTWEWVSWTSTGAFIGFIVAIVIYAGLAAIVGHYYHTRVRVGVEFESKDTTKFNSGLFNVFDDMNICLWSFCCLPIRWADSTSLVGLMGFFCAFGLCFIGCAIGDLGGTIGGIVWLLMVIMFTAVRYKFRQAFDMEWGVGAVFTDCLSYCFCCWCATAQDARHVDAALAAGNPAVCV